jgi:cytochrome c peroxidase
MLNLPKAGAAIAIWAAACAAGCSPASDLSGPERALLQDFAFQPPPPSPTNAVADDPAAAALGQQFFFDTRFSGPLVVGSDGANGATGPAGARGTISCASCHNPAAGGADTRSRGNTSLGASWTGRNAPSVYNAAFSPWQFWDGRRDSLWSQALGPVESPAEHNFSRLEVAHLIADVYRSSYSEVFGAMPDLVDGVRFPSRGRPGDASWQAMAPQDQAVIDRIYSNFGKAIAAYERKLLDKDSAFDRYLAGDAAALAPAAVRGARLFVGRASCNECHTGPTLSDGKFHNTGAPQVGPAVPAEDHGREDGIAKALANEFNGQGPYSDFRGGTLLQGLPAGAALQDLRGAFKTPPLRGVARTAPYMHTGSFATLREVVLFYRDGGGTAGFSGRKDPAMQPLALSDQDVSDLVAFLESLDGAALPPELTSAPVLP